LSTYCRAIAVPELPEVETVRRGLNKVSLQQPMGAIEVLLERTIATSLPEFKTALEGCVLHDWGRRGKYLLGELRRRDQPAGYLGVHLRMTGQLRWVSQSEPIAKHDRVRFLMPAGKELRYIDQRSFGQMWWVPPDREPAMVMTGLQRLGPEPFGDEFSGAYLAEQLRGRRRPIKNALLDQSLVAGVGNIYADESLFLSGIHPTTLCADLRPRQIVRLRQHVIQVLLDSIAAQGTTFSDFRTVEGINGNYGGQAWVYGQDGNPCKTCGTTIERLKMAGRSAHFCPQCQPITAGGKAIVSQLAAKKHSRIVLN
jgi:formamidopyrimidine-DNA glycosylase